MCPTCKICILLYHSVHVRFEVVYLRVPGFGVGNVGRGSWGVDGAGWLGDWSVGAGGSGLGGLGIREKREER